MNVGLYFLVFGESLFNDGVTVVLYNTMIALVDMTQVGAMEILMAFLSFFCVVLGKYFSGDPPAKIEGCHEWNWQLVAF